MIREKSSWSIFFFKLHFQCRINTRDRNILRLYHSKIRGQNSLQNYPQLWGYGSTESGPEALPRTQQRQSHMPTTQASFSFTEIGDTAFQTKQSDKHQGRQLFKEAACCSKKLWSLTVLVWNPMSPTCFEQRSVSLSPGFQKNNKEITRTLAASE